MNEETQQPKLFLVTVNQMTMALLGNLMPGLQFIEVQGVKLDNDPYVNILTSPIPRPQKTPISLEGVAVTDELPGIDNDIVVPE